MLGACFASMLAASACGTGASSPPELEENLASATEMLAITDPATPLAVPVPATPDPLTAGLTVPADAPQRGMWSATQPWPLNGLHSVLLPNGKVLTFGTPTGNAATQDGRYYDVWDPAQGFAGGSHQTSFEAARVNSFCSAAAYRFDGKLLVAGGNSPLDSNLFSPASASVTASPFRLADERWYGSLIALQAGKLLMLGGSTPYGALQAFQDPNTYAANGSVSMTPELYDASTGWRSLFGAQSRDAFGPDYNRYWYPRAWVAPNGQVFGVSSEKMWYLDPTGDGSLTVAGNFKTGVSATTRPNIGPTSAAVMFAPGRILQVGGNGYHDGHAMPGSERATIIDISAGVPVVADTASMSFRRQWPSATVLPDGRVVVTGGTQFGNNGGADAVYASELWNPATGTWTVGASAAQIRVYHSAAILMPNGAVLSTGGGAPGPVNNLNAELYYPPYLFRPAGSGAELAPRPQLTAISAVDVAYGAQLDVDLASTATISKVVLIGTSSVTHSFNSSQRRQELEFLQAGGRLAIGVPASENQAPPGYYLLFVVDANGVPSRGVVVSVGFVAPEPPAPTLIPVGSVVSLTSANLPDYSVATTTSGLGVLAPSATSEPLRAQFVVRQGLADPNCVSFEAVGQAGQVLRHQGYRVQLGVDDGGAVFQSDATFCPEPGLDGSGITLRSKNFPERVLRHIDYELWIDPVVADAGFAADATFEPDFLAPAVSPVVAPVTTGTGAVSYTGASTYPGSIEYQWNFGDGTGDSGYASSPTITHTFASPGVYEATLTVRSPDGSLATTQFVQAVAATAIAGTAVSSSNIAIEPRAGQSARLWVVNIDNDSVSVFDTTTNGKVAEIAVGSMPRSVAVAGSGAIWVANKGGATLSVIDPGSLTVSRTVALPRASQPFGVVAAPNGNVLVTLEALGRVLKLDAAGNTLASVEVGPNPRHLAL
ncbi:MAG TPA: AbfB domain-containing protein, partial [Polyangiaceae bacterium]|nr:AbfB domain-containing protein [Polyangiaceae bacterium]